MTRPMLISAATFALLISIGCGSGPQEITIEPWEVLLMDLSYAWENEDIELMESLFREDFEHHLLQVDWDDYTGDGIIDSLWGLEYELEFAEAAFDMADSISFQYEGSSSTPWSGDSTGQSIALSRILSKVIYTSQGSTQEITTVLFVCRPDDAGEWYLWQWWDQSDL